MNRSEIKLLSSVDEVSMDNSWYDYSEKNHFWIVCRSKIIKKYLKLFPLGDNEILEIGCGNGINLEMFEEILNLKISGCDLNQEALNKISKVKGDIFVYNIFDQLEEMTNRYKMIWLFDVLEHLDDDQAFLHNALKCLKNDGYLLINVPAFHLLYSRYDKTIGHYRRYQKKQMKNLIETEGLKILEMNYWGVFFFPLLLLRSVFLVFVKKSKLTKIGFNMPSKLLNTIFIKLMNIELNLFKNPLFGTSLFVVVQKKQ
jgi:2-polyprenyl-3-methyl-5-hydroxy-6-metoxy-1,4-benzoquinol methylase